MRRDTTIPPRKEKVPLALIREMIARRFQTIGDNELLSLCEDNAIDLVVLLGKEQYSLRQLPDGDYELSDYRTTEDSPNVSNETANRAAQLRQEVNAVMEQLTATVADEDLNEALRIIAEIPAKVQAEIASVVRLGEPSFDNKYKVTIATRACSPSAPAEVQDDRVTETVLEHLRLADLDAGVNKHGQFICSSYDIWVRVTIDRDVVMGNKAA